MNISHDAAVEALITLALAEDIPKGDVTTESCISAEALAKGLFVAREGCVVAGLPVAARVFQRIDPRVVFTPLVAEGDKIAARSAIAEVSGPARAVLIGERTSLNFLQRLCGVASQAKRYADAVAHTSCKVVDTRKTTPGWRRLEKYAAQLGGVKNHRADLSSGILIKDNHIVAAGGITAAVQRAKDAATHLFKVEVEVDTLAGLEEAIAAGADIVLLDNMKPEQIREAVAIAESKKIGAHRVLLEASGGITLDTLPHYAETGVDIISSGAVTHSAKSVDIGLDFVG